MSRLRLPSSATNGLGGSALGPASAARRGRASALTLGGLAAAWGGLAAPRRGLVGGFAAAFGGFAAPRGLVGGFAAAFGGFAVLRGGLALRGGSALRGGFAAALTGSAAGLAALRGGFTAAGRAPWRSPLARPEDPVISAIFRAGA
ncbi:MAG: hypothetical protein KIT72_14735 [Polyangiaceae bacterium]|nr:hypothetical protein [Polyangiaceae bacterium]MCW5791671.1 hypothetical protein [Polyangiaceae bacterium]